MSDAKSQKILKLVERVPTKDVPTKVPEGLSLLEVGFYGVLVRKLTSAQATKSLAALKKLFPDWNELRVSQVQEFTGAIASKSAKVSLAVARDIKGYLQEIFQKNHGFDLEKYREDPVEAAKFFADLPVTGAALAHVMLAEASNGEVPATLGIVRVLDRMGLVKRTSSIKKAQQSLAPLVPAARRLEFGAAIGSVAEEHCDGKKPTCWDCPLVGECPFGKKVEKEWQAQQARLEIQRQKEEERRKREEEKQRKREEAEEKRRAKELEKRRAKELREREREAARKRRTAEKAKREAAKKAAAETKRKAAEAAKKKAEADKKKAAVAKKKAAEAAKKKAAAQKKAAAKKAAAQKKAAAKKTAAKKASAKKSASKKTTKKASSSRKTGAKKTTKRGATKAGTAKKSTARKATKKAAAKKKSTTKKSTTKKATGKKSSAKKPTAKKRSTAKKTTKKTTKRGRTKKTTSRRKR